MKDQKANTTLTKLNLFKNRVGDAVAAALEEALKATVFDVFIGSCSGHVPVVTKDVTSHGANSWRRQVVVKGGVAASVSKPLAGCAVIRTCNVTCGAKYHRMHINTVKTKCACAKKRQCEENDDRGKHHDTPRHQTLGPPTATSTCGSNPSRVRAHNS